MNISSYMDLLNAAKSQPQPQRILFTFARAELPGNAAPAEKQRFAAQQGGALTPIMCLDRMAHELSNFESLVEESRQTAAHWDVVFITTMSGRNGKEPHADEAEAPLKRMIASIESGQIENFLAFNREGELLQFH